MVRTDYLRVPKAATIYRTTCKRFAVVLGANMRFSGYTFDGHLYSSERFAEDAALIWCAQSTANVLADLSNEASTEIN